MELFSAIGCSGIIISSYAEEKARNLNERQ